jgi:hypothetical protein
LVLLLGSSVYRKRGYMYRMFKKLHGDDAAADVCWFAPSAVMNSRLPSAVVDGALADDRQRAGAEFLGLWREDVSDFVPVDVVEQATDFGVTVRSRLRDDAARYVAYCDPATGTGSDSFALCVTHSEYSDPNHTVVVDFLAERKPRFVPAEVVCEWARLQWN